MRTKVKAGGIHNLADARYFSTFAEWIGFQLDPNAAYAIDMTTAKEFIPWIAGPIIVGELGRMEEEMVVEYVFQLGLEAIQVSEPIDREKLPASVKVVIYEVKVDAAMDADFLERILASMEGQVDYFLLDVTADWKQLSLQGDKGIEATFLREMTDRYPVILQLPFEADSLIEVLETLAPAAINLTGGIEEKVGLRSFEDLDALVEQLY